MKEIKSIFLADYPIAFTSTYLQIGCEQHSFEDWMGFDDARILQMDGKAALKFWREWKDMIFALVEKSPAVPTNKPEDSQ